ncbi:hypothetical protein ACFX1R_027907 [Malus domestica]
MHFSFAVSCLDFNVVTMFYFLVKFDNLKAGKLLLTGLRTNSRTWFNKMEKLTKTVAPPEMKVHLQALPTGYKYEFP